MRTFLTRRFAFAVAASVIGIGSAHACDLCGIYSAVQFDSPIEGSFRLGAAEQFTYLNRIQRDGHYVDNVDHQYLKSSVTQVVGSYDANEATTFQVALPVIARDYRRIEDGSPQTGSTSGIGDISLVANYVPVRYAEGESLVRWRVFGGLELPTGDAHLLGEEATPHHEAPVAPEGDGHTDEHDEHMVQKHGGMDHETGAENAIHGHDLALGSGSWDVPFGTGLILQQGRYIVQGDAQYTIRTEGAYDYTYANDWVWSASTGRYLHVSDDAQVSLRARLSGQYKGKDTGKGGVQYEDTAMNTTFIGPELTALSNHSWLGVLGWDVPLNTNNSDLQITPSWRVRAALTYRF
jgi:hypothetical protein